MAAYDDLNVKRIFSVGVISVILTAVTALAVQVLYFAMLQWQQAETASESDYRRQRVILDEQSNSITSYGVNPETGNVIIPIERSMELMVKEQTASPEKSSKGNSDET